jgi:hypothetical protein
MSRTRAPRAPLTVVPCSTLLQVPFLNLMSNIVERAGAVHVRLGGNTQDTAAMVNATQDGKILEKNLAGITNPVGHLCSTVCDVVSPLCRRRRRRLSSRLMCCT